jgi:hypothetical protein
VRFCVGSAFRNAAGRQVSNWISQCLAFHRELRDHYYCSFRAIAVEGDSTDSTRRQLISESAERGLDLTLHTCNHGGPIYGSTEQPERMVALSKVGNAILDAVDKHDDVLVYVESDLLWDGETIRQLIDRLLDWSTHDIDETWGAENQPPEGDPAFDTFIAGRWVPKLKADVWAPVVMAGDMFYDCFVFRDLDGNRIYHPFPYTQPTELGSAGSCLIMPASIARDTCIRMSTGALVEWCEKARGVGYRIAVDPSCVIRHPA